MINSKLNKLAWKIRKAAAKNQGVKVLSISWKHCLNIARINRMDIINSLVRKETAFKSIKDIVQNSIRFKYRPSLNTKENVNCVLIAHHYNLMCRKMQVKQKAFEW